MILYYSSVAGIRAENLCGFFEGWQNPPSPEVHLKILENSDKVVLALDSKTGNVVGFVTAITDGVLAAYIPLLEVLPAYRGKRIGRELMGRILDQLGGMYMVDLLCDPKLQPFYARFGMKPAAGMMLRNFQRQSGEKKQ